MGLLVSIFLGFSASLLFAYFLYWLDRYEKEPKLLLGGVFLWGVVVAAGSAFIINTTFSIGIFSITGSESAAEFTSASIIAPIVEETLKGLAVLIVFLVFRHEFDSVLDGMIYAGVAALGFAATENSYYIFNYGYQESGWGGLMLLWFIRVILVGWQHPFYTAFFGIGLAFARLNRNWAVKILAPILGLAVAMFTHALHNTLAGMIGGLGGLAFTTFLDWTGWLFMGGVAIWATAHEQAYLRRHLLEEVKAGLIRPAQYQVACSAWRQTAARLAALFSGRYRATARFFQVCGELAHKKQQLVKVGDEAGNMAIVQSLRAELARLAPQVNV
jgi:RsiW-degrading membrane proteinase PrsW (M82 family)